MERHINKLYAGLIAILLTIIGFFLSATYSKISQTNQRVYELQVQLASILEKEKHFMTYQDTAALIDKKITQYHREKSK